MFEELEIRVIGISIQKRPFETGGKGTKGSWDLKYLDPDLRQASAAMPLLVLSATSGRAAPADLTCIIASVLLVILLTVLIASVILLPACSKGTRRVQA